MRQFFVEEKLAEGETHSFSFQQKHHVCDVLRMRNGDDVRIVDTEGSVFLASVVIDASFAGYTVKEKLENSENERMTVLCAALVKKEKWELIIQKACELGVSLIVPLITERTIIRLDDKETAKKLQRYNKIALEACQQSNRGKIVEVAEPIKLKDISLYRQKTSFVCYENEDDQHEYDDRLQRQLRRSIFSSQKESSVSHWEKRS